MSIFYVAAHALIINEQRQILLTRRAANDDYMPLLWDIPGGTVEAGETVEESLARELKEEVNIAVDIIKPIYAYSNLSQMPVRQTVQIVYLCKFKGGVIQLNGEHEEFKWIGANDISELDTIAFLGSLIENVNLTSFEPIRQEEGV